MFVRPTTSQRGVIDAKDDVAKRYRTELTTKWEDQQAPGDVPPGNFDRTFDDTRLATDGKRKERKEQAHKRGWQSPRVPGDTENVRRDRAHEA